ncbi:DUF4315 family protein [Enterococcus pallens]|uniref:DUF4315 family protein n=1 Tax=Enterococcus pallens ATCC BAA-351 TaxID=1158607 RepID=R2SDP8_9ENTE|nr:DUF4315 family protein [Enterococcus pallens]EOH86279.1 hypothetical protein UAU_05300 [Enterococcus pallens ATCC BAA-351]EOU09397.1 hypothetical protein I588_05243 [Enterococcus pallens ATCC BAA-351]OJG76437.1 hypothetical protein RV10_GL003765 [Enterococcus pallens]
MAKKTVEERISKKKTEIEQLQKRIDADNQKLKKLKGELEVLETSQVMTILEDFKMSPDELRSLLRTQSYSALKNANTQVQSSQQ